MRNIFLCAAQMKKEYDGKITIYLNARDKFRNHMWHSGSKTEVMMYSLMPILNNSYLYKSIVFKFCLNGVDILYWSKKS